ncbi:MAG: C10 family peptidase [Muribaculaceae bacterium]|nr:C10 family peptidase [Muribaculaceae bacterium]
MKIKFTLSLLMAGFTAVSALAAPVSPDAARKELQDFRRMNSARLHRAPAAESGELELVYSASAPTGATCFYVFNNPDGQGFAIVSADDRLPGVLGFSDNGSFDPENIPVNVKWWLGEYEAQISAFLDADPQLGCHVSRAMTQDREPIAQIISTQWDQGAPYNNDCPVDYTVGRNSVTGCVATALAQVMHHYEWPLNPQGSANGYVFSGTTLDWENMIDDYSGSYTPVQAAAVAQLMRQCGAGVSMMYSAYESGAYSENVPIALTEYFDYSRKVRLQWRDYHRQRDWDDMVYAELAANRPVYYCGSSTRGGHAFVCDGYLANGYFHFNWGWGGYQDGYFLLSALNPLTGGTGSYAGGYNSNQMILTNVIKNDGETQYQTAALSTGSFCYRNGRYVIEDDPRGYFMIYNPLMRQLSATFGIKVVSWDNPEEVKYFPMAAASTLKPMYGIKEITATPSGLSSGKYRVYPAFRNQYGDWDDVQVPSGVQQYVTLEVKGSDYSYSNDGTDESLAPRLIVGLPSVTSELYGNTAKAISVVVSNVNDGDFNANLYMTLSDSQNPFGDIASLQSRVMLPGKSSTIVEFTSDEILAPGTYDMYFDIDESPIGPELALEVVDANIALPSSDIRLKVSEISPNFITATDEAVRLSIIVENSSAQTLAKPLTLKLLDKDFNTIRTLTSQEIVFQPEQVTNLQMQTPELSLVAGTYYWAIDIDGAPAGLAHPLIVTGASRTTDGITYKVISEADKTAAVISSAEGEYAGKVYIPESIDGYRIVEVRADAFTFADALTHVTLPPGITAVAPGTFFSASALERVDVNATEVPVLWQEAFDEGRPEGIILSPADTSANLYAAEPSWGEFIISNWTITADADCTVSGLILDPLTNRPYSPYYIGADSRLAVNLGTPEGTVGHFSWEIENGDKGESDFIGMALLPALNGYSGTVHFSSADASGIEGVNAEWTETDVYTLTGVRVLSQATREQFLALPKGVYILRGASVLKK